MKRKRYFIISYVGSHAEGLLRGQINVTGKGYVNMEWIMNFLKKNKDITCVVINNIIELEKKDYNDWIETKNEPQL